MISRFEMILSVIFYERKNIIYGKILKLTKNNTFNNGFCNRIFSYSVVSYTNFLKQIEFS